MNPVTSPQVIDRSSMISSAIKSTDYVRMRGLRLVRPYFFDFKASVKARWRGKSVIEVFLAEFPARDLNYYEAAFADGRLRVSGGVVGLRDPLCNGMAIHHYLHRHEPPVLDIAIPILGQTEAIVAVGKPASMPVHVSGQYRKNTLLSIIETDHPELAPLFPIHRLDKNVSGVLLFARSKEAAETMRHLIQDQGGVEKSYIARVQGIFPEQRVSVKAALKWDAKWNNVTAVPEGTPKPTEGQEAKHAHTDFLRLSVAPDGKTSLVQCWPKTGRTHQIRVHLQHMGHPIANDMQYGGQYWGPRPPFLIPGTAAAKRMETDPDLQPELKRQKVIPLPNAEGRCREADPNRDPEQLAQIASMQSQPESTGPRNFAGNPSKDEQSSAGEAVQHGHGGQRHDRYQPLKSENPMLATEINPKFSWLHTLEVDEEDEDNICLNCPQWIPANYPLDLAALWLHAMEYSCPSWSFKCPPPQWSEAEWDPSEYEMKPEEGLLQATNSA